MATKFEGTFRWGRSGEADVPVELTKDEHGWFCDAVNGMEWQYPGPLNPDSGWGYQLAKATPLAAIRAFLRHWDDSESDAGGVATTADHLTIREVVEA